MDQRAWLTERFEEQRPRLRAVAYRMLGSLSEADDAVQEAWLRLGRADAGSVQNLAGWLTTVVARVCLNMLRTRRSRREQPLDLHLPDPIVGREEGGDPEQEALLAEGSGWRCWWCSTRWRRPSGWPSCCTTCSPCRSSRSPR